MESFPYKPEPSKPKKQKGPPPPSPSKFVKGEFRESDYESDYEGKIRPVWKSDSEPSYKPVRPVLTPTVQPQPPAVIPTPPTQFEIPTKIEASPRPKFEPIDKIKTEVRPVKPVVFKPKPITAAPLPVTEIIIATPAVSKQKQVFIQPGSPPEIAFAPGPQRTQYYRSTTSAPYHNAVQTETSNIMHFDESSEHCKRTVSLQQTTKVIKFGDQSSKVQSERLEPFPFKPQPERQRAGSLPPPPTPSKFIPGEFRESDYESEVEGARIKPKWTPRGENQDLHYRKVRAPAGSRSSSVPAPVERIISPMEFDKHPYAPSQHISTVDHQSIQKRFMENKSSQIAKRSHSYEPPIRRDVQLQPGTPPEYGYIQDKHLTKTAATQIASQHMDSMTNAFKSKTQKFVRDIMNDVNNKESAQKPILKTTADGEAQVYREESRAAQYGKNYLY